MIKSLRLILTAPRALFIAMAVLFILLSPILAGQVNYTARFNSPTFERIDGHLVPVFQNGWVISPPGEPLVSRVGITLLLPPGEEATEVRIHSFQRNVLPGSYYLPPAQHSYPIGSKTIPSPTLEKPEIYKTNAIYPSNPITKFQTQFLSGHGLAYITICPLEYNPVTGELAYYQHLDLEIITTATSRAREAQGLYRSTDQVRKRIQRKVANPENLSLYSNANRDLEDIYQILLITRNTWIDDFQSWVDFKNRSGMPVVVKTIENIMNEYSGYDSAETIRNCIIDAYQQWSTLEYVVLAGDNEHLPHRGLCFIGCGEDEHDIPADLYFVALDGNWDQNGNHLYGEPFEADLVAELAVGRMSVDSTTDIANMINKSLMYSITPVDNDVEKVLLVGEDLGWEVWGDDYKNEIRYGSSNWGYTTVGIPSNFHVNTLYDRNGIWDPIINLLPLLNGGVHLVNHLGHADVDYSMKLTNDDITNANCTNNGINHLFYLAYSQGCYSASFDNKCAWGWYEDNECIAEVWTRLENGALAYIGNSRYGWGDISCTNGASQRYDREFFDALFGEGITRLGWANGDSKEDVIPFIDIDVVRYVYYCLNIIGDPTLDIWTAEPEDLQPVLPNVVLEYQSQVEVDVPGISGATVAVSHQGELIGRGETNNYGHALITLDPAPAGLDPAVFVITAHNYHYFQDSVTVIPQQGPYILVSNYRIDDSSGNNNGELDYAETISLDLTFKNVGIQSAQGLTAELLANPRYYTLITSSVEIGDISVGDTVVIDDAFRFRVNPMIDDQSPVVLSINIHDSQDSLWTRNIYLTGHAPEIQVQLVDLNEHGYGHLAAGDPANFSIIMGNLGSSSTPVGHLIVTTDTPLITVTSNIANIISITPGGTATSSPSFTVAVSPVCPEPSSVVLYFTLADSNIQYYGHTMTQMYVGEFFNNVEAGEGNWTHGACQSGFTDQWHLSNLRNHSPFGQYSWKCGGSDTSSYSPNLDAGLVTHEFTLPENMILTFWHWMEAETSSVYVGRCYDGGIVEISQNGQSWIQIEPMGGYRFLIRNTEGGPFAPYIPVLSGSHDWEQITFDLSNYVGNARLRFRFGSNSTVQQEGWYLDDIEVRPYESLTSPENLTANLQGECVELNWTYSGGGLELGNELSFNLYRNGVKLDSLIEFHAYQDYLEGLPPGIYYYYITAQIDEQESGPSNTVSVEYNGASVPKTAELLIPKDYILYQNYPNPFNSSTTFRYGMPESKRVSLKLYNILGQEVAVLVDETKSAGYHLLNWDAQKLASGIYFCQMQAGGFQQVSKLVLLK